MRGLSSSLLFVALALALGATALGFASVIAMVAGLDLRSIGPTLAMGTLPAAFAAVCLLDAIWGDDDE